MIWNKLDSKHFPVGQIITVNLIPFGYEAKDNKKNAVAKAKWNRETGPVSPHQLLLYQKTIFNLAENSEHKSCNWKWVVMRLVDACGQSIAGLHEETKRTELNSVPRIAQTASATKCDLKSTATHLLSLRKTRISVLRSGRDESTIPLVPLVPLCTRVFALIVFFHSWSLLLPRWGTGRFISGIWVLLINSMLTPSRKVMQLCPLFQRMWAERQLRQEMARFHEYHTETCCLVQDLGGFRRMWGSIKRLNDTVQEGCLNGFRCNLLPLFQRARKARNMAWCLSFPICRDMPSTFAGGNWDSTAGLAWFSTSSTTFSIPCIHQRAEHQWMEAEPTCSTTRHHTQNFLQHFLWNGCFHGLVCETCI